MGLFWFEADLYGSESDAYGFVCRLLLIREQVAKPTAPSMKAPGAGMGASRRVLILAKSASSDCISLAHTRKSLSVRLVVVAKLLVATNG